MGERWENREERYIVFPDICHLLTGLSVLSGTYVPGSHLQIAEVHMFIDASSSSITNDRFLPRTMWKVPGTRTTGDSHERS